MHHSEVSPICEVGKSCKLRHFQGKSDDGDSSACEMRLFSLMSFHNIPAAVTTSGSKARVGMCPSCCHIRDLREMEYHLLSLREEQNHQSTVKQKAL